MASSSLVFRLHDRGPELVRKVLLERGWKEYDGGEQEEEDWNLYWRASAFRSSDYHNLLPWQRLNHHPKTVGITRKDCLVRNLRRMRATFGSSLYHFSPAAFILPNDHTRFLSEYTRRRQTGGWSPYWICKPVDLSQGRGIFIFEDYKDLIYDSSVVIQRYISNPLLISGYKFDLRIYVCVKNFHPLTIYMHQEGLVRFATDKYNLSSLDNLYAHLTNTSINKLGPFYTTNKERVGQGCKWAMNKFRCFLRSQGINELLLWQKINNIVTLTLLSIAPSVPSSPNCVELFGFDVLIDSKFKPWLLEVNSSPALTLDCQVDVAVKKGLISDLIDLMNYRSIDSLRERAYRKQLPRYHASQASRFSTPVATFKELKSQKTSGSRSSQTPTQTTGWLKYLPPVDLNKRHAAREGIINSNVTTATKPHTNQVLTPIFVPHSRITISEVTRQTRGPAPAPRTLHTSEVTHHGNAETEMESSGKAGVSSETPDLLQMGLGSLRSKPAAGSWKLPHIRSGRHQPDREGPPALRVGDFILTFPFNRATLNASQHKLDVKLVIQELHKLTCQLASGCSQSDKTRRRKEGDGKKDEGVRTSDGEEDFESLLWGPKDPPLLSQCFPSS
ncbi:putative tubulin polyglutamylase TTLL2 [Diretmus argenteus]